MTRFRIVDMPALCLTRFSYAYIHVIFRVDFEYVSPLPYPMHCCLNPSHLKPSATPHVAEASVSSDRKPCPRLQVCKNTPAAVLVAVKFACAVRLTD